MIAARATQPPTEWTTVEPGEVDEAELLEPAVRAVSTDERARAPRPVAEDRVGHGRDEGGEHQVAAEAHPLGDRAGHERRRRRDEPELEEEEGGQERAVALEDEGRRADEAARVDAEHQAEAEQPEQRRRDEEVGEVLDRDVDRVLRPDQAALERREARLHEEDECRADEQPGDVDGLYNRHGLTGTEADRRSEGRRWSNPSSPPRECVDTRGN